ncbi:MAG: M20/M25/M40 family metallo-hydrolase [Steroidobacterales bacterium]
MSNDRRSGTSAVTIASPRRPFVTTGRLSRAWCVSPPGAATFFSDASVLTPAMGMPTTIILGPGEPGQAHQTDEWCSVAQIHAAVEIYRNILRDWSQAADRLAEQR